MGICLMTNCRNEAPASEAMCAKHRNDLFPCACRFNVYNGAPAKECPYHKTMRDEIEQLRNEPTYRIRQEQAAEIEQQQNLFEMIREVIMDRDLDIRIENFGGQPCVTILDELCEKRGCAQLRGESNPGLTVEQSLRDACDQALNHKHPADPEYSETTKNTGLPGTDRCSDDWHLLKCVATEHCPTCNMSRTLFNGALRAQSEQVCEHLSSDGGYTCLKCGKDVSEEYVMEKCNESI